jgi:hypothetical protein
VYGILPAQRLSQKWAHIRYFTTQVAPPGGWVQAETTPGSPVTSSGVYIGVAEPPVTHGKDSRSTSS